MLPKKMRKSGPRYDLTENILRVLTSQTRPRLATGLGDWLRKVPSLLDQVPKLQLTMIFTLRAGEGHCEAWHIWVPPFFTQPISEPGIDDNRGVEFSVKLTYNSNPRSLLVSKLESILEHIILTGLSVRFRFLPHVEACQCGGWTE